MFDVPAVTAAAASAAFSVATVVVAGDGIGTAATGAEGSIAFLASKIGAFTPKFFFTVKQPSRFPSLQLLEAPTSGTGSRKKKSV